MTTSNLVQVSPAREVYLRQLANDFDTDYDIVLELSNHMDNEDLEYELNDRWLWTIVTSDPKPYQVGPEGARTCRTP